MKNSSVARIFQGGVPDFLFLKKSLKYNLFIKFLHFFSVIKFDSRGGGCPGTQGPPLGYAPDEIIPKIYIE